MLLVRPISGPLSGGNARRRSPASRALQEGEQPSGPQHRGRRCLHHRRESTAPGDPGRKEQFRSMGRHDARDLAVEFIASYQRTAVLTQALREPALLSREGRRLERWIDSLDTTE